MLTCIKNYLGFGNVDYNEGKFKIYSKENFGYESEESLNLVNVFTRPHFNTKFILDEILIDGTDTFGERQKFIFKSINGLTALKKVDKLLLVKIYPPSINGKRVFVLIKLVKKFKALFNSDFLK